MLLTCVKGAQKKIIIAIVSLSTIPITDQVMMKIEIVSNYLFSSSVESDFEPAKWESHCQRA